MSVDRWYYRTNGKIKKNTLERDKKKKKKGIKSQTKVICKGDLSENCTHL